MFSAKSPRRESHGKMLLRSYNICRRRGGGIGGGKRSGGKFEWFGENVTLIGEILNVGDSGVGYYTTMGGQ